MGASNAKMINAVRCDGKTAVITGANTGIGKVTASELYKKGARVIMACRDEARALAALEDIKKEAGTENVGELIFRKLDLNSLDSVRECAQGLLETEPHIHLLINNAGIMMCPASKTKDGFETQFGVNHLGHFLLTNLLLPTIKKSVPARIITVSSRAHERGTIDFSDLNWEKRSYSAIGAYSQSKLANVLFSMELAKKLDGSGISCYSLHPGVVKTELGRHMDETYFTGSQFLVRFFFGHFFKTPEQGAMTTLFCALDDEAGTQNGLYYSDCRTKQASAAGRDEEVARKLWEESCKLVNLTE